MPWQITEDLDTYLATAGSFLRAHPTENTILLGVAETLQARGPAAFGEAAPLFGWRAAPGGEVDAAFLHTPPYPVVLSAMPADAATSLAASLAGRGHLPPGVNAATEAGAVFAAAWQERTGQPARAGMRMLLYRLGRLLPPNPPPPGQPRTASASDRDLMVSWLDAFHDEAGPAGPRESRQVVDDRLSFGGLILWEDEGTAVSLAARTRPAAGQARVGPVYTPPDLRGRGFGAAATAAVTQAALDDGADGVLLFTDQANPTSNTLYQRLGYQPACDWAVLIFGEPD
jgi:GNAT superfamily N-acetyltransferase